MNFEKIVDIIKNNRSQMTNIYSNNEFMTNWNDIVNFLKNSDEGTVKNCGDVWDNLDKLSKSVFNQTSYEKFPGSPSIFYVLNVTLAHMTNFEQNEDLITKTIISIDEYNNERLKRFR